MPAKTLYKKQLNASKQAEITTEKLLNNFGISKPVHNNEGLPDGWRWVKHVK